MTKRNDGGPAFGHAASNGHCCGMTLRDYFAAHAPIDYAAAFRAWSSGDEPGLDINRERAAFFAVWTLRRYEYADAMLAARDDSEG